MVDKDEALNLALNFIERVNRDGWILDSFEPEMYATLTAIKEALAQGAKENREEVADLREKLATIRAALAEAIEEADACHDDEHGTPSPNLDAARAVLAKLKQNNSSDSAIDKELQRLGYPL